MSKRSFVKFLTRLFGDGPSRKVFRGSSLIIKRVDQNVGLKNNHSISRKTRNRQSVQRHH